MNQFSIEILGRADRIKYTDKDGKITIFSIGILEGVEMKLKHIKQWEPPYEDEEISLDKKQEILNNVASDINKMEGGIWNAKADLSYESNVVHYDEIFNCLKLAYNLRKKRMLNPIDYLKDIVSDEELKELQSPGMHDLSKYKNLFDKVPINDFKNMSEDYKYNLHGDIPYLYFEYCKLSVEEMEKFKEEIKNSRNIQNVLLDFAKWKVNEGVSSTDKKGFAYGLYALDMTLTDNNKEEIKEVLKQYKEAAKTKRLSFEEFTTRNRPLNDLIKEIL